MNEISKTGLFGTGNMPNDIESWQELSEKLNITNTIIKCNIIWDCQHSKECILRNLMITLQ